MLGAALAKDVAIIALHLTRPGVTIPDREKLGLGSYELAAKGAYVLRDYKGGPKQGVIMVQGTMSTYNLIRALDAIENLGAVDVVCLDKTGTLTENRMTAERFHAAGGWDESLRGEEAGMSWVELGRAMALNLLRSKTVITALAS